MLQLINQNLEDGRCLQVIQPYSDYNILIIHDYEDNNYIFKDISLKKVLRSAKEYLRLNNEGIKLNKMFKEVTCSWGA